MGLLMKNIRTPNREHWLIQKLKCQDYDMYAPFQKDWDNYYVGQTMILLPHSRTTHRALWSKFCYTKNDGKTL